MISKLSKRLLGSSRFSTLSPSPSLLPTHPLTDYQYVQLIEQSPSIDSYNLLLHSYYNNVVLDYQTFKTVWRKMGEVVDGSYQDVLYEVWRGMFKSGKTLEEFKGMVGREEVSIGKKEKSTVTEGDAGVSSPQLSALPSNSTNPILKDLMNIIKTAGKNNSNLILNNVEIEFDYKYLYGNPLINEGLEEYEEEQGSFVGPEIDATDILSCMKKIKIGEVQFVTAETGRETK